MVCDRDWQVPEELDAGYAATFSRLRGLYRSRGLSWEDAADLAQEAIARALLHLRRHGCNGEPVTPLVNKIASNLLIDHLRSNRGRIVSLDGEDIDVDEPALDPSEEVARRHVRNEVRAAIASLPERHQHAIAMSLDGRTPAEIADHLGIRRNAADALLFRARRGLADLLRAAGTGAWVAILVVVAHLRTAGRRVADMSRAVPAALVSSQAGVNLAGAAVATAMAFGTVSAAPAAAGAGVPATDRPASAAPAVAAHATPERLTPKPSSLASASLGVREHRATVATRAPGSDEDVTVETWHRRDPNNRGVTGPILDQATVTMCALAASGCEPGGTP